MNNKKNVAKLIDKVFNEYCDSFNRSLNCLKVWPWTDDKTVIHESNQVHRFLDAYQKTGKNIITWMELPVYQDQKSLAHIDAFIVDNDNKLIFFIEAKRFSKPAQVESLQADVNRLFKIAHKIYLDKNRFKGLSLLEYDSYMISLADIWDYRGKSCETYASRWKASEEEGRSIAGQALTMMRTLDIPDEQEKGKYHLLGALMPVFDSKKYQKEIKVKGLHEAVEASIYTYANNYPFEILLEPVNK